MTEEKDIIYFIAQIGHEIRTPINAIKGFGDLLLTETFGDLNPQQKKYLEKMVTSSDNLLEIVNQILDWAKLESGQAVVNLEPVDLRMLTLEVANLLEMKAKGKGITLNCAEVEEVVIQGDSTRVREVLINLANNSVKFTPSGGRIDIKVQDDGDYALLAVADTGRGIPREQMESLFQPFNQGKELRGDEKGTGLGLWICQSIVELHQGKIWGESEVGKGTTFYIQLPKKGPNN